MATNAANILSMVDSLPTDVKTELLEKLLNSLNPTQKEIDKLWEKEAELRVSEIKSGKVKTIPGDKVFADIRNKFSK
jgi:putative addiction module component (TIGR02574 family)